MHPSPHPVLIAGGSLVGLSAALFLASRGVPTVLVEPHLGSSPHPRAVGYTPRTMELFRGVGLGDVIPQVPPGLRLRRARVESLAGTWFEESPWTPPKQQAGAGGDAPVEHSPCTGAAIAQDGIEPILRERAIALGADLRLGAELVRFEQDDEGVTAWIRERGGRTYSLRASYLIAADGNRSPVREALGIGRDGRGQLQTQRSVLFRAPLEEYLAKGVQQFQIDQPDLRAFLSTYGDGRWVLMFADDDERDEATLLHDVRQAIGRDDIDVELITTGRWALEALVADRFSQGRVFLAGDAAHCLPPTRGGFGANTGIQDAHNLAWKLAAVLAGTSTPGLLDTYDAERRPVAWERMLQTFARPDYAPVADGIADGVEVLDEVAMEFGQLYRSTAVLGAGDDLPPAARPDQWAGQPGTRVPHLWVDRRGRRASTLDLFGDGWVLLAAGDGWRAAAEQAAAKTGTDVEVLVLGVDVTAADPQALPVAFGLGAGGAGLVRPDGVVAWRSPGPPRDGEPGLADALCTVTSCAS